MKPVIALLTIFLLITAPSAFGQTAPIKDSCITASNTLPAKGDAKLHLYRSCEFFDFKFTLYNRWGNEMYTASKFQDILDLDIFEKVKVNGKLQYKYPTGTYVWKATYSVETVESSSKRVSMGTLTIISQP